MSDNIKFEEILFSSPRIIKNYKRPDLENKSSYELEIMIRTLELEIQKSTSSKGIFLSCVTIMFALIIAIKFEGIVGTIILAVYGIAMGIYYFDSSKQISKLYDYLNELRYLNENK